ncbi:hypothetical protein F7734_53420 [Scytonema sp. UIC 10036]|uniref:hypothetical protein n=1 Tax=Scytonema sp. UIC 10036 TaxID=2304196 RepID=UPI0012DA693F|nr:hypothetical protein [Scytonema sp. UIC 10036]MUH00610.1 hypothetical protein [Scytonema sp. UIC 10036]
MIYQCGEEGLTWFTVYLEVDEDFTVVLWFRPINGWNWTYYFQEVDEMWRGGFDTLDKAINAALQEIDTYFD